jgi:hypothetical protein
MPDNRNGYRNGHGNGPNENDLDSWLHDRIEPLPPPPGTFEAIRKRARRRKYRKLAVSAGAAAIVIAAAVTVPTVVRLQTETGQNVAGGTATTSQPALSRTGTGGEQTSSATPIQLPEGNPVPPHFQPASVTAVSDTTLFTIGQAGTPGQCATQYCTSVARTQNAGHTWTGLPAPITGAPNGAHGVGQIRFLEGINGWAFGPELWATHNGGEHWTQIGTHGQRVIDVETVGARAFAIEAACTGGGTDFAAQCTSFTLYSTPAKADDWIKVSPATTNLTNQTNQTNQSTTGAAALALTGSRGYLLGPDGALYAGPVNGSAAWQQAGTIPCDTGQAQLDGEPAGALLGAVTAQHLLLACTQSASGTAQSTTAQTKLIYASSDGGKNWELKWTPPPAGVAASLTSSPANPIILATSEGIEVLPDGGSWRAASLTGPAPATGFSFVGMTNFLHGFALPADPADGTVWFTTDGGLTWAPSAVASS